MGNNYCPVERDITRHGNIVDVENCDDCGKAFSANDNVTHRTEFDDGYKQEMVVHVDCKNPDGKLCAWCEETAEDTHLTATKEYICRKCAAECDILIPLAAI